MTSITSVLRVMAPLLVYFLIMFAGVLFSCKRAKMSYGRTTAQAFTGASNNFEVSSRRLPTHLVAQLTPRINEQLAIAVSVAAYGAQSPQALAATVGPLVECVPLLSRFAASQPLTILRPQSSGPPWPRLPAQLVPKACELGPRRRRG